MYFHDGVWLNNFDRSALSTMLCNTKNILPKMPNCNKEAMQLQIFLCNNSELETQLFKHSV